MRGRRRRVGTPWGQYAGLALLAVATVVLCYLALAGVPGDDEVVADPGTGPSSSSSPASTADPGGQPTLDLTPPTVRDQRRADFTDGDGLPDGAVVVDGGGNESGLALSRQGLTHGAPTGEYSAGAIEVRLDSDVRSLGFRVRFAGSDSGAATLVGWQRSIAEVVRGGSRDAPPTGFRLVATPGEWAVSVLDEQGEDVLAEGTYEVSDRPARFEIVREGDQVWVVDPTGAVTTATDPRVASLAGPWATWGLTEAAVGERPAVIEAVWGG